MIISVIIFIFTLLILVLIHEFGHFLMAKKFGIKVEEFGFGIPPRIWGKKIGETLYSLNWLPLGGFVKLLGEENSHEGSPNRNFSKKPVLQRITVVVFGVVMNLILAWILFYIVIISQNFHIIYPVPEQGVFIQAVEKNFPAEAAGVKIGDQLLSVENQKVNNFDQARNLIKANSGKSVNLILQDLNGKSRTLMVTPKKVEGDLLIGVIFSRIPFKQYSTPTEKLFSGITYSRDLTGLTFVGLGRLFHDLSNGNFGKAGESVTGPVGMAVITNDIVSSGWQATIPYLWFVGVISLTLSIFNVLPIPALDGGRLLFLAVEAVSRKKVKEDIERLVHQVGFVMLLSLALLITFSDIRKMFHF